MEQTITAIYDNGMLIPLHGKLPKKKLRVKVTILEEIESQNKGISIAGLKSLQGKLLSFKEDPVEYQRRIRDEW
jgi:predicted DNA-binding antitoxin AbrB/MazE fold protein